MTNIIFYKIASSCAILNVVLPLEISAIKVLVIVIPNLFLPNFEKLLNKTSGSQFKKGIKVRSWDKIAPGRVRALGKV